MGRFLILLFCIACSALQGQNTIGLPEVVSFPKEVYNGGTQNWKIGQDLNGIMYFANNEGLLTFDGSFWKIYPVPNKTIVRSLAIVHDRIYVGAQSEIGYFSGGQNGVLKYTSLTNLIAQQEREFADVWDIIPYGDQVFFRSNKRIFQYSQGKIIVYRGINWSFLGYTNGQLIANEFEKGMLVFSSGKWIPFVRKNTLPENVRITSVTSMSADSSLITTLTNGLFILSNEIITPFATKTLQELKDKNIYSSIMVDSSRIAILTNFSGCYIISRKGQIIQRISKQDGLLNNNILSTFKDKSGNLWLGLDNGINLVAFDNAINRVYPDYGGQSAGYAATIYKNRLYMGTSTGLYVSPVTPGGDISLETGNFRPVPGAKGQVWNLTQLNGALLMGHNLGFYQVNGDEAYPIDPTSGFWTFIPLDNILPSKWVVAGNYNGINLYQYTGGRFVNPSIHTHFESARFVVVNDHTAWVAHPYKGLYKIDLTRESSPANKLYEDKGGILSSNKNYIFKVKGRIILSTGKGLFEYHSGADDFLPSKFFRDILRDIAVQYLREDERGNVWFISDKRLGVIDFSGSAPEVLFFPEINSKVMSNDYEFIYPYNSQNIFIAAEKGFFHLNYDRYKKRQQHLQVILSNVTAVNGSDSTILGGYFLNTPQAPALKNAPVPSLSHSWNSLQFSFSSPAYSKQSQIEYAFYLRNFDKGWSQWSSKTEKEYTNLPGGDYTFEVRSRLPGGEVSPVYSFSVTILPPWYRTTWAYLLYAATLSGIIYLVYYRQKRKFRRQHIRYEEEQKHLVYVHQLERERDEKEIIRLRNEKLEAEINLKNAELASTTFNLVQNGERLIKIKDEILKLKGSEPAGPHANEYKKIIKMLGENTIGQSWEEFALHFDRVHNNFLVRIKNHHPNLTPTELKLCAYLRLNLTSKEISKIMNITTKSVELARYRLRKKLEIPSEMGLFSFLSRYSE